MKVCIYTRVSTIDKGQTLEQQEVPLIEFCKKEGWEFEVFKEYASGAKESRPQLDLMMQKIRNREFDAILIFRLDRLGRSLKHLLQLIEEFKNKKIRFICFSQNIDTSTSQGMFMLHILASASEFERQLIKERIQDKINYHKKSIEEKGYFINKDGKKMNHLGRPAGSKDKKIRRKSGYLLRWSKED
jgi:DNA invertase Pin-like site-specific DNA recombinase